MSSAALISCARSFRVLFRLWPRLATQARLSLVPDLSSVTLAVKEAVKTFPALVQRLSSHIIVKMEGKKAATGGDLSLEDDLPTKSWSEKDL